MGVETSDREPWIFDTKIALQSLCRGAQALTDQPSVQLCCHFGKWNMRRHRDHAQVRASEHHDRIVLGYAAAFGNEFGLAGVRKPNGIKLRFGNRTSDQSGGAPRSGKANRHFQRLIRTMRAVQVRDAWYDRQAVVQLNYGQGRVEMLEGIRRVFNADNRAVPVRRETSNVTNGKERRQARGVAGLPCFSNNFRPDTSRITDRNGQRQFQSARRHQLYSITASRRKSRR